MAVTLSAFCATFALLIHKATVPVLIRLWNLARRIANFSHLVYALSLDANNTGRITMHLSAQWIGNSSSGRHRVFLTV